MSSGEQACGRAGEERAEGAERAALKHAHPGCEAGGPWELLGNGELGSLLCEDLEGWGGEGVRGFRREGTWYPSGGFMLVYGRDQHSIVKQ